MRLLLAALLVAATAGAEEAATGDWPFYGGDAGGTRWSPLADIDRTNIAKLRVTWTFRTGHLAIETPNEPRFETTPIVVDGTLYLTTPLGQLIALDPATGVERWRFDPKSRRQASYGDFANRGVAFWQDERAPAGAACRRRIFLATIDARLYAVDGTTGKACRGFGTAGVIDLRQGLRIPPFEFAAYQVTSPPLVIGDLVVTGAAIADNSRIAPASGEIRAFDARSGRLRWRWDPIPQKESDPAWPTWEDGSAPKTGGANAWTAMVADPARGLIFAATSSPAPDYFGGLRPGRNEYANSVVAIRAVTGMVAWHFQTVHHDLWDYDNASPPALITIRRDGREIPAVAQATKTGMLFVLHRETGQPLFPVEERKVVLSDVPEEYAWPRQPFSSIVVSPQGMRPDEAWGANDLDRDACRKLVAELRNEGIFTPPSPRGTLVRPSNIGGAHWGGLAWDPGRALAVVPVNTIASMVQLMPANFDDDAAEAASDRLGEGYEYTLMEGTGYVMRRRFLRAPSGNFCSPPPWGLLVAVDLNTGRKAWEVPLGSRATEGPPTGTTNLGGPIATAGGLVFIGAATDRYFRAFDIETGRQLWQAPLPNGARATPMTYRAGGRQYVVIAAGGEKGFGAGETLVAYALP